MTSPNGPARRVLGVSAAILLSLAAMTTALPAVAAIAYGVDITGDLPDDISAALADSSILLQREEDAPATQAALDRRIEQDRTRFLQILRAEGFHDADIAVRTVGPAGAPTVEIAVDPGPRYAFGDFTISAPGFQSPDGESLALDRDTLGVARGAAARAENIVAAESEAASRFTRFGYPRAAAGDRQVLVDHESKTVAVHLTLELGSRARLGPVSITGLDRVEPGFVRRRIPWVEGQLYDSARVDSFRRRLLESGLFDAVTVAPADAPGPDGTIAIDVTVTERKPRSIGVGASFSTADGIGGRVFWTHRNLFGEGENLRVEAEGSQQKRAGNVQFRIPDFLEDRQSLVVSGEIAEETTDAFDSLTFGAAGVVERRLGTYATGSAGIAFDHLEVEQSGVDRTFELASLPVTLRADTTDNLLNPSEGVRAQIGATPQIDLAGSDARFVVLDAAGSAYWDTTGSGAVILAARARIASILGASLNDVPASRRLYAGGGGSVRGYAFQEVGPLDGGGDPIGGRSAVEVGAEARFRITDEIGIVPFIDGGMVYTDSVPDFGQELLWGAGLGVRYFTAVGPIRADIAVPLNGRSTDDDFQFYISLGQAF